jgi:hypothetical protein
MTIKIQIPRNEQKLMHHTHTKYNNFDLSK